MALTLERSLDLGHDTQAAAGARDATMRFLEESALAGSPVPRTTGDIALLVVSELVTNAVRHTSGPCSLRLSRSATSVDIDVTDTSPDPPVIRPPHVDGSGGWGWILVNHLVEDVTVRPAAGGGKTVHARIAETD
ncbi:ATP-binding protein [Streptomyces sp. NPDC047014]|uniref:ATP-binding protein n=1 Tax=Streptomyces sp. NPDC047014 TaxID=3155736 RepID=UPI0033E283DB